MKKNVVVFYDNPCIDGAAAAWAIHEGMKRQANVECVPLWHGKTGDVTRKIMSHLHDGVEAIFVDTTPEEDVLELLFNPTDAIPRIKKLTVVDHHVSEMDRLKRFQANENGRTMPGAPELELVLDSEKPAAALLAWEHFNKGKPAPKLLSWVGKMEPPVTLVTPRDYAIAAFIDSKDLLAPEQVLPTVSSLVKLTEDEMVAQGTALLADQWNKIQKGIQTSLLYAKLELRPGKTEWVPVFNADINNFGRRIDHSLIKEANAGTTCGVSGTWCVKSDGAVKLSLRSNGVPDVSEIAKYIGKKIGMGEGGGHATAAVVRFQNLKQFVDNVPLYTKDELAQERWADNPPAASHTEGLKRTGPKLSHGRHPT